jgi:FMN phosphatase YigB (HAD superfamily)
MENTVTSAPLPRPGRIRKVIFDFDSTLFDTEKKKHGFYEIAECHGYTRAEAKKMYDESRRDGNRMMISIAGFLSVLRDYLARDGKEFKSREVSDIIDRMNKGTGLLPGAKALLEFCKRRGIPRMLLSLGVREWQEEKARKSGVDMYFEPDTIVYTDVLDTGKIDIIRERFGASFAGDGVVLFNDKPDETADMLRAFPDMFAYVRREERDDRYAVADFDAFAQAFPDRAVYADDLQALRSLFQSAVDAMARGSEKGQLGVTFIDFDNTLYDTHALDMVVRDVFLRHGVRKEDADRAFFLAVHGESGQFFNYTFDAHIDLVRRMGYDIPAEEIREALARLPLEQYEYPDAETFLRFLRERSERLVLLTAGNRSMQEEKIKATALAPYFDEVVILQERKDRAVQERIDTNGRHLFVNDDVAQNMLMQKKFPNLVVVTKQHPVRYTREELLASGIPSFPTLTDIIRYVESL